MPQCLGGGGSTFIYEWWCHFSHALPNFIMFSTGLQSIVNTELARIAVSSLHGMS